MPTGVEYEKMIGQLIAYKQQNQTPGEVDDLVQQVSEWKRSLHPPGGT